MITVYDIEVAVFFRLFHQILLILELLMIIPGLLIILACGHIIFFRVSQFHSHVHMLMASIFFAYFIVTAARVIIILLYFTEQKMQFVHTCAISIETCNFPEVSTNYPISIWLDGIRSAAASSVLLAIPLLTFERLYATFRLKTYERERHRLLLFSFLLICSAGCCTNAYLIISGVPLVGFIAFGMTWLLLNLLAFQRLVNWSQEEYEKQMRTQPLTVRFQLSENVRLGRILLAVIRAVCFGVILALILVILVILVTVPYGYHWATLLIYHVFEMELASASAFVAMIMIYADKKYAKEFSRIKKKVFFCKTRNETLVKRNS